MASTHRTTIAARVGHGLAAAALLAGLAIGIAAVAGAERVWDLDRFDKCMAPIINSDNELTLEQLEAAERYCCAESGGVMGINGAGIQDCQAPAPEAENVPGQPGPTTTPPVLQNPPAQPSNPLVPTPRGPNSGTLG